jgi:hypothetical protein
MKNIKYVTGFCINEKPKDFLDFNLQFSEDIDLFLKDQNLKPGIKDDAYIHSIVASNVNANTQKKRSWAHAKFVSWQKLQPVSTIPSKQIHAQSANKTFLGGIKDIQKALYLCARAGFSGNFSNHSLRGTTATRLFQNGVDEQLICNVTGHSSLSSNKVFIDFS